MTPWFSMPSGSEALRAAALAEARAALTAIRCAVQLLTASAASVRERELLTAIDDELTQIRRAVGMLSRR